MSVIEFRWLYLYIIIPPNKKQQSNTITMFVRLWLCRLLSTRYLYIKLCKWHTCFALNGFFLFISRHFFSLSLIHFHSMTAYIRCKVSDEDTNSRIKSNENCGWCVCIKIRVDYSFLYDMVQTFNNLQKRVSFAIIRRRWLTHTCIAIRDHSIVFPVLS